MQKWEYAVIETTFGPLEGGAYSNVVSRINGKSTRLKFIRSEGASYHEGGEQIHDYLNRAGQEGWRVVGSLESAIILEREIS